MQASFFLRLYECCLTSVILGPSGEVNPVVPLLASLDTRAPDIHRAPRQVVARRRSSHRLIHLRRAITTRDDDGVVISTKRSAWRDLSTPLEMTGRGLEMTVFCGHGRECGIDGTDGTWYKWYIRKIGKGGEGEN